MRWSVFAFFGFIFVVAETSLQGALVIRSFGNLTPSFLAALVTFLCLFAPRRHALWACWLLGLVVDLLTELVDASGNLTPILGPNAIGFTVAGMLLLQVRAMLFRRRPLTLAVVTVLFVAIASLVTALLYSVHAWYPGGGLAWAERGAGLEILRRFGGAIYSGLLALILGAALVWTMPAWGFQTSAGRR